MRKFLTSAVVALTFGGAVAATAVPAQAQNYYGDGSYGYRRHSGDKAALAAFAGIAGLALGAALSSSGRGGGYGRGYSSGNGYYSGDGYSSGNGYYSGNGYSSSRNGYSYDPRYDSYGGSYYDSGYQVRRERICTSRERVWDPYIERNVTIERRYPC